MPDMPDTSDLFKGLTREQAEMMTEMEALRAEELDPELRGWVEDGTWGPMLRHPLVYQVPLFSNGVANRILRHKGEVLNEAVENEDWHTAVFLYERPYRLGALVDLVTGYDEDGEIFPLNATTPQDTLDLVADVWVDSENIEQNVDNWRALIGHAYGLWLGDMNERLAFDALPDPIPAWRGGSVGDWSWTTDKATAEFFSRRSGHEPRHALIPKADCFGYLTRRGEYELLVRLTDERRPLVYPVSGNEA